MKTTHTKTILALFCLVVAPSFLGSQDVVAASSFFQQVAERYAALSDYTAFVSISIDDGSEGARAQTMAGNLYWKRRSRLRIDFTSPKEQVIVSDGEQLQIYIPQYNVTLRQKLDTLANNPAGLATDEGLSMMRRGYNIGFKHGAGLVALDEGGSEKVYKLLLTWKNSQQGFRTIELSVTESRYIRRIDAVTGDRRRVRINFTGMGVNVGIPDIRFTYDAPPESNNYEGFLFGNTN